MKTEKSFKVFGELVEVVASSESTRRSLCIIVQTSPPGGGPPPHVHEREDEVFSVVDGEYELFDGQAWHKMREGEYRIALRGQVHTFRNCGATEGKIVCIATPGGLDEYLETISPLVMPQDLGRLTQVSEKYGIKFVTQETPQLAPV
jgi:quercetin dioxygenase-like cupin family protein